MRIHWKLAAVAALAAALLAGCYGTYGPEGPQPYGTGGTGQVIQGQEIEHEFGRSCFIDCGGQNYVANCPANRHAVCQCNSRPYAACQ